MFHSTFLKLQNAQHHKALIIASAGTTTDMLYAGLSAHLEVVQVFIESPESKGRIIKRRLKKVGFWQTAGQVLFLGLVLPFVPRRKKRIESIITESGFADQKIPQNQITRVETVHDEQLAARVNAFKPSVIFINGTRILKKDFLDAVDCPVVNIHVGITPKYRGVHGGYWALRNGEPHLFGVTLHWVDKGIDTGNIIAQKVLKPKKEDNFKTYPILQYAAGIELAIANLPAILEGKSFQNPVLTKESKLHYHPTIWTYLLGKTR